MTSKFFGQTLEGCINTFPVELKMLIYSYLHMGIILSLYDEKKSTILDCIKMERFDRNHSFSSIFRDFTIPVLIDLILKTESINKKYIMRHYHNFKEKQKRKIRMDQEIILKKEEKFATLIAGDIFMHTNNQSYIIIKKNKKTLDCIKISVNNDDIFYNGYPTIFIPLIKKRQLIKICSISIIQYGKARGIINIWLSKTEIVNNSELLEIKIQNLNGDSPSVGVIKKESRIKHILQIYK